MGSHLPDAATIAYNQHVLRWCWEASNVPLAMVDHPLLIGLPILVIQFYDPVECTSICHVWAWYISFEPIWSRLQSSCCVGCHVLYWPYEKRKKHRNVETFCNMEDVTCGVVDLHQDPSTDLIAAGLWILIWCIRDPVDRFVCKLAVCISLGANIFTIFPWSLSCYGFLFSCFSFWW